MEQIGKATEVKRLDGFRGDARLFTLDPPHNGLAQVVVSAVDVFGEPETYIFAADETGEITDYLEMSGSFRGALDHVKALNGLGYEVPA